MTHHDYSQQKKNPLKEAHACNNTIYMRVLQMYFNQTLCIRASENQIRIKLLLADHMLKFNLLNCPLSNRGIEHAHTTHTDDSHVTVHCHHQRRYRSEPPFC